MQKVYDNSGRDAMNQKGLVPVILLLIVVVALAAAFGVWRQSSKKSNFPPDLKAPTGKLEEKVGKKVPDSEAVLVVKIFCDNFFKGPPATNEQGVMIAFGLLSQKAKQSMPVVGPSPSAALASFAGVQDVPDQGYTIDEISEGAAKATVKTTWNYSSGNVTKTFELGKEEGNWKIDALQ